MRYAPASKADNLLKDGTKKHTRIAIASVVHVLLAWVNTWYFTMQSRLRDHDGRSAVSDVKAR